jgi:hypothetical protein
LLFDRTLGIPKVTKKNPGGNRFSGGGRRAGGPGDPGRIYGPYFYILQASEEYKNDLAI